MLSTDEDCVLEKEPLERLAAKGELMSFQHNGFFFAMDTYREHKMLNDMWDNNEAPWKIWSPNQPRQPEPDKNSDKRPRRGTGALQLIKNGGKATPIKKK